MKKPNKEKFIKDLMKLADELNKTIDGISILVIMNEIELLYDRQFTEVMLNDKITIKDLSPSKDCVVDYAFKKSKTFKNRKVLKDSYCDTYYSGFLDCYDWLTIPMTTESIINDSLSNYEYELFINDEGTPFEINSWIPIANDKIKDVSRIDEYITKGLLRKIKK